MLRLPFPVAGATRGVDPTRPDLTGRRRRRHRTALALTAAGLAVALSTTGLVDAAPGDDPRAERERVQAQRAEAALELDAAQDDFRRVSAALTDLQVRVAAVEARYQDAQRAAQTAEDTAAAARSEETATIARIRELETQVQDSAVDAYIDPVAQGEVARTPVGDLTERALRDALIDLRTGRSSDLLDQLGGARQDLAEARRVAEAAAEEAEARRAEVERRLAEVEEAEGQLTAMAQEVENRVNHLAGEVANLAERDEELADQIAEQQAELAAAVPTDLVTAAPSVTSGPLSLATVGGITVNASIAGQVGALLDAARADGVELTGSGYRDPGRQIELRRAHCGSSNYAVYQAPSSACSPPTAVPGTSMHERGLAIDFSNCPHGSACFGWLSVNAGRYGLYNLPSESWHWSTTGQ